MLDEIDEDGWQVGDPVSVTPIMATIGGIKQEVLLVARDPEGLGRVSAVERGAEPTAAQKVASGMPVTYYRVP